MGPLWLELPTRAGNRRKSTLKIAISLSTVLVSFIFLKENLREWNLFSILSFSDFELTNGR